MSSCRMILVCKSIHKLISPIRSRCINLRVPAPTEEDIKNILISIAREQYVEVSQEIINKITKISGKNLRDAISQL